MLINHPTDGATCVFVLFNSNHQAALCNDALFIMERRPYVFPYNCTRSYSYGVALQLSLTVGVVGLALRGGSAY